MGFLRQVTSASTPCREGSPDPTPLDRSHVEGWPSPGVGLPSTSGQLSGLLLAWSTGQGSGRAQTRSSGPDGLCETTISPRTGSAQPAGL